MTISPITAALKRNLWNRYGNAKSPAEWDGTVYGGGKISQRFWEYFVGIELLELVEDSVLLEIGGGSPQTGLGFFGETVSPFIRRTYIMDTHLPAGVADTEKVAFKRELANYESLSKVLTSHPEITHISCISVLEHIEPATRVGIMRAISEHFTGVSLVLTLEYHVRRTFFEHQLTTATLSEMVQPLKNLYLDKIEASPTNAQNAFAGGGLLVPNGQQANGQLNVQVREDFTPLWYPLALRFLRCA